MEISNKITHDGKNYLKWKYEKNRKRIPRFVHIRTINKAIIYMAKLIIQNMESGKKYKTYNIRFGRNKDFSGEDIKFKVEYVMNEIINEKLSKGIYNVRVKIVNGIGVFDTSEPLIPKLSKEEEARHKFINDLYNSIQYEDRKQSEILR